MFNSDAITAASSMLIPLALARLAVTSCTSSFPLLSVLAFEWTTLVIKFSTSTEKTLSI